MEIEGDKSIGDSQKTQKSTRLASGRPPKHECRATEFCRELAIWKQTPISLRPSLHALGDKLGTTHQTLSYHLNRLDRWQAEEEAKRLRAQGKPFTAGLVEAIADEFEQIKQTPEVKRIRGRAEAEGRELTFRERLEAMMISTRAKWIEELRQAASRGPLMSDQFKWLKKLVRQRLPGAKEILEKCRQMTPEEERQARASERKAMFTSAALNHIARITQEAERGPLPWRDIEILKIFARRKCAGAKELLQKYSKSALPRP